MRAQPYIIGTNLVLNNFSMTLKLTLRLTILNDHLNTELHSEEN